MIVRFKFSRQYPAGASDAGFCNFRANSETEVSGLEAAGLVFVLIAFGMAFIGCKIIDR
jgi:hypothetical protein